MQTFNYLVQRFMHSRQAWLAHAIVDQLHRMKSDEAEPELCLDRLLPVWEVIAENLMRHAMHTAGAEPGVPIPFEGDLSIHSQRALYEA